MPIRQDQRYDRVPSSSSLMWLSPSSTAQSLRSGTSYSSKVGRSSCSGRYRATCMVIWSGICSPPVDPFSRRPSGDGDRQVLDPRRAVRLAVDQRVGEEALVVPGGEIGALVGAP